MKNFARRSLTAALAFVFVLLMLPATLASAENENVYVLDSTNDLEAMSAGDKANADELTVGTNGYFTIIFSEKTKIDGSKKEFEDGYTATQRLNFGGKTQYGKGMINSVRFTTSGPATIKLWWVSGGDGREMAIYNDVGEVLTATDPTVSVKNSLYINELTVDAAGTYYIGVPTGSNYLFKIEVTEGASAPTESETPTEGEESTESETPTENEEPTEPETPVETPADAVTYTVVKGDCLWTIAKRYYGDGTKWTLIYEANAHLIKNPDLIYVGQVLVLP